MHALTVFQRLFQLDFESNLNRYLPIAFNGLKKIKSNFKQWTTIKVKVKTQNGMLSSCSQKIARKKTKSFDEMQCDKRIYSEKMRD